MSYVAWFILGLILAALELLTGTFHLLVLGLAAGAGGVVAMLGGYASMQFVVAAFVGVIGVIWLHRSGIGRRDKVAVERDPNVNLDIGGSVRVEAWHADGKTRVTYRGAGWDAQLADLSVLPNAQPGIYTIIEIRGSTLILQAQT